MKHAATALILLVTALATTAEAEPVVDTAFGQVRGKE